MGGDKRTALLCAIVGFVIVTVLGLAIAPLVQPTLSQSLEKYAELQNAPLQLKIVPQTPKVLLVLWTVYAVAGAVMATSHKNTRSGEEHGSAKWGNAKEIGRKLIDKEFHKNRILSANINISVIGRKVLDSLNTFIFGGMGSGKSYYLVIPNLLQANTSFVVTDPSGELAERTGWFLKHVMGYQVRVVDVENIENSSYYNFFKYIRNEDDIITIADIIFDATSDGKKSSTQDPMWENMAKDRLIAYIALLWQRGNDSEKNMDTVLWMREQDKIVTDKDGNLTETTISALFKDEEMRMPGNMASSKYVSSVDGEAETIMGVNSTLNGRLGRFLIPSVRRMMSHDELELDKIGDRKTALFLVIPEEKKSFNFIVSMIYAQIFDTLFSEAKKSNSKKLKVPVQFWLDEAANVVLPKNFTEVYTTGRKHGVMFNVIMQDYAQAEKTFPNKKEKTIIGTSTSFVYMGGSGNYTEEEISRWIGDETIMASSQSVSYGHNGHSSKSLQPSRRRLITADEIERKLGSGNNCLVKVKGYNWVIDQKYNPRSHPNYKYCADVNGMYYDWSGKEAIGTVLEPAQYIPDDAKHIEINLDNLSMDKIAQRIKISWEEN